MAKNRSYHSAMVSWIRRQYDRFRSRREARREEELQRFIEEALRPENVERCQRNLEKQFGRLVLDENGFHLLKDAERHIENLEVEQRILRKSVRWLRAPCLMW